LDVSFQLAFVHVHFFFFFFARMVVLRCFIYTTSPPRLLFLPPSFCSTDEDTAEYLYDILSIANYSSWITQERHVTVGAIQEKLQGQRSFGKVYEERVAGALATLRPTAPTI
jgi:hypothetical protein